MISKSLMKIGLVIGILMILVPSAYAAGGIDSLSVIGKQTGILGHTVNISINATNMNNIGSLQFDLIYNSSVIRADSLTKGSVVGSAIFSRSINNATGKVTIGLISSDGVFGNGSIADIKFTIVGTKGQVSPLNISLSAVTDPSNNAATLPALNNNTFTVVVKGDVDGYAGITMADAMYIGKAVLNKPGFTLDTTTMDVDGQVGVTLNDALYLAKYVIGASGFETLYN